MWSTATRFLSISGSVQAARAGMAPLSLPGVAVDVYRFQEDEFGEYQFTQLNPLPAITDETGAFEFSDLPMIVQVRTVIPGTPPYEPVELVHPDGLPNLVFRVSAPTETRFIEIHDERAVLDADWEAAHPERLHVPLTGSPPFEVEVPDYVPPAVVPGWEFHFLRVGRAARDEIGELGETRPDYFDYQGKPGYMVSSNVRTVNAEPSLFPGQVDAPFGGTLQIGGHFGANFQTLSSSDNLYYTVSFWQYSGDPALPFDRAHLTNEVQIQDPLHNKRYTFPTPALPRGKWETLPLGPFSGTITAVEAPHSKGLVGTSVMVYKWIDLQDPAVYWLFPDLVVIWNSTAAPDSAAPDSPVILTLEVYERTGSTDTNLELKKLAMDPSVNDHLPLRIDNRPPVPKYLPYDATDPDQRKFHTAYATFIGLPSSVEESVGTSTAMNICNEMPVSSGDTDGNECILVRYSVEDGAGNPHQHVADYSLWAEYTPKAVPGAPDSTEIELKDTFIGFHNISDSYSPNDPPTWEVNDFRSVIVPENADGWPPEPNGDTISPPPCPQYALEVSLRCRLRTVNGWGRLYHYHHVSRHIIVKRIE
jgi:hypothetical protein